MQSHRFRKENKKTIFYNIDVVSKKYGAKSKWTLAIHNNQYHIIYYIGILYKEKIQYYYNTKNMVQYWYNWSRFILFKLEKYICYLYLYIITNACNYLPTVTVWHLQL